MSDRSRALAEHLRKFNDEVKAFVEACSDEDWRRTTAEDWTVGVVARHIGAGHYGILGVAQMIVKGEPLPPLTEAQIVQMANDHAREHAGCTRAEVLEVLRDNGESLANYVADLDDKDLDRTGYLAMIHRDVSTREFLEMVILKSGGEHLANMKTAVGL